MSKGFSVDWRSLTVQMVLSFAALVLLTAAAIGFPAIVLILNQTERQAWDQVNHASQATLALYNTWQSKTGDLATLTANRPTLKRLTVQGDVAMLVDYLQTLEAETELDSLQVCDADNQPVAQVGQPADANLCDLAGEADFYTLPGGTTDQIWLLAASGITDGTNNLGRVIAGIVLDDEFAAQMQSQTGLAHTLIASGQPLASSMTGGVANWRQGTYQTANTDSPGVDSAAEFRLNGKPYYVARLPLDESIFEDEVALDVTDIAATKQRLVAILTGSIIAVVLAGSALGLFLARRVGQPLTRLASAAKQMSTGNLDRSVSVQAQVREVAEVAQALESARVDLQKTLSELRQANAWTDHLLDAISEGIVTLDQHGRITFFSPGAERITGLSRDEALNQHCDQVFQVSDSTEPFSQCMPAPARQNKLTLLMADGRLATLSITGAQLAPPGSDETEMALVFRDVTETELVHRLMGEFLANITHEFRTPVSALAASTELLLDQAPDLSQDELYELLTSLYLGIVGLQTLVDNLLESARLEVGRFRVYPRPVDLGEIIAEATRIMQPLLDRHRQRLVVELPAAIPMVQADSRRVTQVLVNLLSNANKYSPDETEIAICAAIDDGWARIAVADQGPGIPDTYRPSLFRRFAHPEPSASKSRYGAGLGLSVAKAITEAHGGQVGVDNRPSGGSIFWFTLALADES